MNKSNNKLSIKVILKNNNTEIFFVTHPNDAWTPEGIISSLKETGHLHIVDCYGVHYLFTGTEIACLKIDPEPFS